MYQSVPPAKHSVATARIIAHTSTVSGNVARCRSVDREDSPMSADRPHAVRSDPLATMTEKWESGDLYGLMLFAVREWAERDHPEVTNLVLLGEVAGGRLPGLRVPITSCPSSESDSPAA